VRLSKPDFFNAPNEPSNVNSGVLFFVGRIRYSRHPAICPMALRLSGLRVRHSDNPTVITLSSVYFPFTAGANEADGKD
jgi:hypothetical protein